jgi:hypothetical protein
MADRQSAALRFINAPWLKPFIFLFLIVVAWDDAEDPQSLY